MFSRYFKSFFLPQPFLITSENTSSPSPFFPLRNLAPEFIACFPSSIIQAPKNVPDFPSSLPLTLPLHLLLYDFPKQKPVPALVCILQLLARFSKHTSSKNPSLALFFSQVSINDQTLSHIKKVIV